MVFVAKRILIITNEMKFALNVKKALEKNGEFTVAVFSSGKAGVDHVRQNEQDVAVLDFRMKDMPGTDMVDHVRTLQHDIAIIAAPNHPAIHDLKERYNLQDIINIPISIRKFVGRLNGAVTDMRDSQNDVSKAQPLEGFSVGRSAQTMEFWLADNDDGETVVEITPPEPEITPEASATFERLLAEEPPMPAFVDGSTIRDLRDRLSNLDEIKKILASAAEDDEDATEPGEPITTDGDSASIPAARILEAAMDESTPIQTFSLQEFMTRVAESEAKDISPLPSWKREDERYVAEPDFLPNELPFPELDEAIEYTGTVTMVNAAQLEEQDPGEWVTDPIEPVQRSRPAEEVKEPEPVEPEVEEASTLDEEEVREHIEVVGRPVPPPPPELPDLAVSGDSEPRLPFVDFDDEDSELAQLATTLTQVALELTADATVLARDGEVVGYAGKLPMTDLEGLLDQLTVEWDKTGGSDKSRILFATIPETGAEFMVSTRGTNVGFTLSLIFSGTRQLHDIRRQSKRLLDALESMPELAPEPEPQPEPEVNLEPSQPLVAIPPTEEIGIRTPIAYLWLQRNPAAEFDNAAQTKILKALDVELTTSGWKVGDIQAPDYIYIYGEMPASLNPRETLDELMQKTAGIIQSDAESLWDDSYLILQPGRELKTDEIERFIDFARR